MNHESLFKVAQKMIPNIDPKEFEEVAQHLTSKKLKKNEIWEHEGKISSNLGFVHSGILREYHIKDGIDFTTDFFTENDFLGNYISYQNKKPSATFTAAIKPCELWVIPFEKFEQFYDTHPNTFEASKKVGDKKVLELYERNSSLLMDSPEERYYKLLETKPDLINRVPQYLIAQYLGIRPESLSRIRKRHNS